MEEIIERLIQKNYYEYYEDQKKLTKSFTLSGGITLTFDLSDKTGYLRVDRTVHGVCSISYRNEETHLYFPNYCLLKVTKKDNNNIFFEASEEQLQQIKTGSEFVNFEEIVGNIYSATINFNTDYLNLHFDLSDYISDKAVLDYFGSNDFICKPQLLPTS